MVNELVHLETDVDDGVAIIRFNRPRVLNAFNNELMGETIELVERYARDDEVRVIVVTGNGRAFSAGFDLKASAERQLDSVDKMRAQMQLQFDFIMQFWHCPKPTIAAVHGFCLAGAFELALACDITLAARGTRFGEPEVRFGTGIVAMLLPWITGPKQAKELLLTGNDQITAERAERLGIVNRVVEEAELLEATSRMAMNIRNASSVSIHYTKRAINHAYSVMGLEQALQAGLDMDIMLNSTPSEEKRMFAEIRREQGVKAAIAWRDARFNDQAD
jgi:enoyl-CoA hydratase